MKRNSLSKWIIVLQSILLIIFTVSIGSCAEANQKNTVTAPQPGLEQSSTFTAPQSEREQINKFITPQEAFTLIQKNQNNPYFVIIDDRDPAAFSGGHIARAINIPISGFQAGLSGMDKNKIYLVYCRTGCGAASREMKKLNFKEVYDIQGGLDAWKSAGLPVVK